MGMIYSEDDVAVFGRPKMIHGIKIQSNIKITTN